MQNTNYELSSVCMRKNIPHILCTIFVFNVMSVRCNIIALTKVHRFSNSKPIRK